MGGTAAEQLWCQVPQLRGAPSVFVLLISERLACWSWAWIHEGFMKIPGFGSPTHLSGTSAMFGLPLQSEFNTSKGWSCFSDQSLNFCSFCTVPTVPLGRSLILVLQTSKEQNASGLGLFCFIYFTVVLFFTLLLLLWDGWGRKIQTEGDFECGFFPRMQTVVWRCISMY